MKVPKLSKICKKRNQWEKGLIFSEGEIGLIHREEQEIQKMNPHSNPQANRQTGLQSGLQFGSQTDLQTDSDLPVRPQTDPKMFKRIPKHIGVIPDGNRRWAKDRGMEKQEGYRHGIDPGFQLYEACRELGVEELTLYGFTVDNTKRPSVQKDAFQKACVEAVQTLSERDAELLVVGNTDSPNFPKELMPFTKRSRFGKGGIKVNFLVNYGWDWDLRQEPRHASSDISRIDLVIRWGGHCRLSGFLPVQSVYADIYVLDELWPQFRKEHLYQALKWYQEQDVTLGG